jgi:hypothetical protein
VGDRRAGHISLGSSAVRLPRRAAAMTLFVLGVTGLGGCTSIGSIAGAVTGAASGGGSANPGVGYAVGITTKAATDALVQYISRERQGAEQDQIAATVGALAVGQSAPWRIHHKVPLFDDEHGDLTVVREIPNALAACKEVVFSVAGAKAQAGPKGRYITTACRHGSTWRWALAEPSTVRWGFLQ